MKWELIGGMTSENIIGVIEFSLSNISQLDENSMTWSKFISVIKTHNHDENGSMWWKLIYVMKGHHCDRNQLCCWNYKKVMKSHQWWILIDVMKICHRDKKNDVFDETLLKR